MNSFTQYLKENNIEFYQNNWQQHVSSILKHKNNALFVTSSGWRERNILEKIEKSDLDKIKNYIFIDSNYPSFNQIKSTLEKNDMTNIDLVIALGGGSVIDFAKSLIYFQFRDDSYINDIQNFSKNVYNDDVNYNPELLAIPTTVGSGSEMTSFATIWDYDKSRKYSIESYFIKPKYIILDESLLASLKDSSLFYPIFDSFSHSFDSLSNVFSNNLSENIVDESLEFLLRGLNDYEKDKKTIALKNFAFSSMLAGLAIQNTKTSLSHSLSYPLTLNLNVPHGLACISTIPSILDIYKKEIKNLNVREIQLETILKKFSQIKEFHQISNYTKNANLKVIMENVGKDKRLENFKVQVDPKQIHKIYSTIIHED